ncbi:MAG TPA: serine/threonine-protein kinase [Xanthomonadaceae bacterium]|nr:serine/threonine-protein kinase [Xanthomonadaceae bacterium]
MSQGRLPVGSSFGEYEILAELGGGSMGRVYHALDKTLQRMVAIKTLSSEIRDDPVFLERFLKEARAAARLNHPNIAQIYTFGIVGDTNFIAMEFVDGQSLGEMVRRQAFSEKSAIVIVRQAAQALGVAHVEGLIHRDIKPDNIMLTHKGVVKIVDLGIAKHINESKTLTQAGQTVGTPAYASPEQVECERPVDARSDIYSLGATLFHLVTGRMPYDGASATSVMIKHVMAPVPDPRDIDPGLSAGVAQVIMKMMAKRPEDRYPDAGALERDLYRVQLGMDIEHMGATAKPSPQQTADLSKEASGCAPKPGIAQALGSGRGRAAATEVAAKHVRQAVSTPARDAGPGFEITAKELQFLETELAREVGPLARVLVKSAVKRSGRLEDAIAKLEAEIPTEAGRRIFSTAVKRLVRDR